MSPCGSDPRLGTEPRLGENERVSEVRFSSKTLSVAGSGPAGTGVGRFVGVLLLSGLKIVLKPVPVQVPTKAANAPRLGGTIGAGAAPAALGGTSASGLVGTSPNKKPSGREIFAVDLTSALISHGASALPHRSSIRRTTYVTTVHSAS